MKLRYLFLILLLATGFHNRANAISRTTWEDISNYGIFTLIGASLITPTVQGDWKGLEQAFYSNAAAQGVTLLGKSLISERRPDGSDNKSFPSGHAANSFASATTLHRRYGWKAGFPAYALATLTAGARVGAKKHDWVDVSVGAIIGGVSGWYFTDAIDDNVVIVPWADTKGAGVNFAMTW